MNHSTFLLLIRRDYVAQFMTHLLAGVLALLLLAGMFRSELPALASSESPASIVQTVSPHVTVATVATVSRASSQN